MDFFWLLHCNFPNYKKPTGTKKCTIHVFVESILRTKKSQNTFFLSLSLLRSVMI